MYIAKWKKGIWKASVLWESNCTAWRKETLRDSRKIRVCWRLETRMEWNRGNRRNTVWCCNGGYMSLCIGPNMHTFNTMSDPWCKLRTLTWSWCTSVGSSLIMLDAGSQETWYMWGKERGLWEIPVSSSKFCSEPKISLE